jgi:hypothetical protein
VNVVSTLAGCPLYSNFCISFGVRVLANEVWKNNCEWGVGMDLEGISHGLFEGTALEFT